MEIFLLLLDECDDAIAVLRMQLAQILRFLLACALLAGAIWAVARWPGLVVALLCWVLLLPRILKLRFTPLLRLKTDP